MIAKEDLSSYLAQGYLQGTGVDYSGRAQKTAQSKLQRYGDAHYNNSSQRKQTCLERYGVTSYCATEQIRQQRQETSRRKYGVDHPMQSVVVQQHNQAHRNYEESLKKKAQTMVERYGVPYTLQSKELTQHFENSLVAKYGVRRYAQTCEYHRQAKKRYEYQGELFDSLPEVALWVYAKDHGEEIVRTPCSFEYEWEGQIHHYFPDFYYRGQLVEIKGNHFFEGEKMINP